MATEKKITSRIQQKHDVAANWAKATNFIPKKGEIIIYDAEYNASGEETQAVRFKIGDGSKTVNNLPFAVIDYGSDIETLEQEVANNSTAIGTLQENTVTGVKMNGTTKNPSSGVVDLGTVLTDASKFATSAQGTKADNAMPKSGGTFTGEVKFGSTENFQGYYIKRMIGSLGAGTRYADLDSSYKDGTWYRMWRLRFPSDSSFWGKIKITLYGGYSSFNASGVMSKSITCNFNTSSIYNNVGCYDGLGVNVEQDFRISEAIWNATASAWEILIWQKNLSGNNSPTIMLECWTTNNTNYINAFNGIAAQAVELTQSTSYSAQRASSTGGTKTVEWTTLPVYENPLGEEIATMSDLPKIPTVNNGTLTIQKNGSNVQTFSANQTGNVTANIAVPTKVSELTNDRGFITLLIANTSEEFDSFIVEDNIGRIVSYNGDLYLIEAKIDKNAPNIKVGDTINALYFDTTTTPNLSGKSGDWIVTDTYDVELTVVETGERFPVTLKDGLLSETFEEEHWLTWRQCAPERDENGNFVYQEIDGIMYPVMNETETVVFRSYDAWVTNPPNPIGWLVDKVVVDTPITVQEINSQEFWGDFISSAATIFAKNIGGATSTHTHTITPSGSVASTFTGKSMTSTGSFTPSGSVSKITHTPAGSVTISATDSTSGNYTPAGTISKPKVNISNSASSFLTGASLKASLADDTLTLSIDTSSSKAMTSAAAVLDGAPIFTGTKVSISGSFSGTEFSITPTFTGTEGTVSVSGTTTGSVSSSFTGTSSQTSTPV